MDIVDVKIKKNTKKKRSFPKALTVLIIVLLVTVPAVIFLVKKGKSWFDPISIVSTVAASNLKESDGRTNLLLLGSDNRTSGDIQLNLTDSILLVSIGRVDHDVVLISLPRDLWVEDPRGVRSKINEVYANNKNYTQDELRGGEALMSVTEDVLGIPIHYYAVINFALFKEVVNTLGGVDVMVDRTFTDYWYPVEGKETAPLSERYETVTFEEGLRTMDGDTALKYVRSRKGTNGEDTDFARSERQQKVIAAVKEKALSLETLVNPAKVVELYNIYVQQVDTNINLNDIQSFYLLSQQIDFDRVVSIVLDDRSAADEGGLLYSPIDSELYGGAYVLIPKAGNFSQLHAYVQRYLFSYK
jgi:LCP family protein required for cell wall assembly